MNALDREKARKVLWPLWDSAQMDDAETDAFLDALAGCVTNDPPTIDRDALLRVYEEWELLALAVSVEEAHQHILALLRPDPRFESEYQRGYAQGWADAQDSPRGSW